MKILAILTTLIFFLVPITTFAQIPVNDIKIESVPDTTDIAVTIGGDIGNGILVLKIIGMFGSDSEESFTSTTTITEDNPSTVFELDYPFLTNEIYYVTAINGFSGKTITWIPLLSIEESSTTTNKEIPHVLGQIQTTSVLVNGEDAGLFVTLRDENKLLSQEIEKKEAVMMEQVLVIKDLVAKISNVKFTNTVESISQTVEQVESTNSEETFELYLQNLNEENKLLNQEIENKDAIIMEQLKVIQDLAEKVRGTTYEHSLKNFFRV